MSCEYRTLKIYSIYDRLKEHPELYTAFLKEKSNAKKELHEAHALRMAMLYHLAVANHFREKTFWMPCNLDFRGRAYPIPPYGSHVGTYHPLHLTTSSSK
jgi:DNA-directed RNA polymerase